MGRFKEAEKDRQSRLKGDSALFSALANRQGEYSGKPRSFCLPVEYAEENLFSGYRDQALRLFSELGIRWHDGRMDGPSNHLCDSQVCCANFLMPFTTNGEALADLFRKWIPDIEKALPVERGRYLSFEWIGAENYLGERIRGRSKRTRGAHFTSADAIARFELSDGTILVTLIEWKYTESYNRTPFHESASGTNRVAIYEHLWDTSNSPIAKDQVPSFESLFYEPAYQLFRQQALGLAMEHAHELEADRVWVLHVSPKANHELSRVTSPELAALGTDLLELWPTLLKRPETFLALKTENLFWGFDWSASAELRDWWEYISKRYAWHEAG